MVFFIIKLNQVKKGWYLYYRIKNILRRIYHEKNNLYPQAANDLIDAVEEAIRKRKPNAEAFERYHSINERRYPYYRIYVKNYVIYYVVIDDGGQPVYLTKNGHGSMVVLSLDSYSKLVQSVEFALNEADKLAETTSVRYTHGEVFEKIRNRVNK